MNRFIPITIAALALATSPALGQGRARPAAPAAPVQGVTTHGFPCDPANLLPGCRNADGTVNQEGAGNLLEKLNDDVLAKLLADFTYASARAHATNNTITMPCWDAWVKLLTAQQQPLCGPLAPGATAPTPNACPAGQAPLSRPDPHVITTAELASELINELQPNSDLSIACAPTLQASQRNIATLVGAVLSGGALGLFKLP
jgi:hypothetical protein